MKDLEFKISESVKVDINKEHTFNGKIEGVIYLVSCDDIENKLLMVNPEQLSRAK